MEFLIGILGAIVAVVIFFFGMIMGWAVYDRDRLKEKEKKDVLRENTLRKVGDALIQDSDLGFKEADAIAVINVLHNAGIVFRERSDV